jgi:hypothetical protein
MAGLSMRCGPPPRREQPLWRPGPTGLGVWDYGPFHRGHRVGGWEGISSLEVSKVHVAKHWKVDIYLSEEIEGAQACTYAEARLTTGDATDLRGHGRVGQPSQAQEDQVTLDVLGCFPGPAR